MFKKIVMKCFYMSLLLAVVFGFSGCTFVHTKPADKGKVSFPVSMPYNKVVEPAGTQIFFGDSALENHALDVVLSPDGKTLAVEGRYRVVFIRTADNKILYDLVMRKHFKGRKAMNTYSGITWLRDGGRDFVLWGNRNDLIQAEWNGETAKIAATYHFERKKGVKASLPNEMVVGKENDDPVVYLVLNGNDEVVKLNLHTNRILWQKPVGLAPYGITMARGKLYVSDWSGAVPAADDTMTAGIPWEAARVDRFGTVASGTVSVLDPKTGETRSVIQVGLHPNKIISGARGKVVFVANGNSDNVSVINTLTDKVVETIPVRLNRDKNPYFGDSPNGLALSPDGKTLYVANGMDNALAVVQLGKKAGEGSVLKNSRLLGFIPTATYPGGLEIRGNKIYVADIEGIGARLTVKKPNKAFQTFYKGTKEKGISTVGAFNAHRMLACVSVIQVPGLPKLKSYTQLVRKNNRLARLALLDMLPRKSMKPVPVPQRIGEPSVFKHVIYIIKENRTYDQILGDVKKGNGDADLCTFGKKVTPNTHKLVNEYVLLDNYQASGKCSAEGHLWTDASIVTDYIEKNVRAWFRSYTHVLYDAMAYPKTGFLWDDALDHGKTVRIYGETAIPYWKGGQTWLDVYRNYLAGKPFRFTNKTTIARVRGILSPTYPGYDSHNISDQIRAKAFIAELHAFEKMKGDRFPDLCIMALPDDHTAGISPKHPTPRAMVADNDYALGKIVEAITKSRFWKNTVIFITEDDSQSGWDHVSAYRTVGTVVSPYTRTGKVVSTAYNQTSLIRTIEQILGLPPMNIMDASATPMFDVFSENPDTAVFTALKNRIPLDEMNPPLRALKGKQKEFAIWSMKMAQRGIDAGSDDMLNRIIWSSVKNHLPYPARYAGKDDDDD
jgi:YVTN family beta-propeller protein